MPLAKPFLVILFVLLAYAEISSNAYSSPSQALDLRRFITKIADLDPELTMIVQSQQQQSYLGQNELPSRQSTWNNRSSVSYDKDSKRPVFDMSQSLTHEFHKFGSLVDLNHRVVELEKGKTVQNEFSMNYEQRLLRGRFGSSYKTIENEALLAKNLQKVDSEIRYQDRIKILVLRYFDAQYLKRIMESKRQQLALANSLLQLVKKKARSKVASPLDLARSEEQVLSKKIAFEDAVGQYDSSLIAVQRLLRTSSIAVGPSYDLPRVQALRMLQEKSSLRDSRQYKSFAIKRKALQLSEFKLRDAAKGDISAFFGAELKPGDESPTEVKGLLGLKVSFKIGEDSQLKANLDDLRFKSNELANQSQKFLFEQETKIADVKSLVERDLRLIDMSLSRVYQAKLIVKGEKERYQSGRSDLSQLLQSYEIENAALLSTSQFRLNLKKHLLEWLYARDQLTFDFRVHESLFLLR